MNRHRNIIFNVLFSCRLKAQRTSAISKEKVQLFALVVFSMECGLEKVWSFRYLGEWIIVYAYHYLALIVLCIVLNYFPHQMDIVSGNQEKLRLSER